MGLAFRVWVVLVIVALDGLYTGYMSEMRIFNNRRLHILLGSCRSSHIQDFL